MTTASTQERPSNVVAFRDAQWETRWLVVGLSAFLLLSCAYLLDREWVSQFSPWLLLVLTGLVPHVFLLVFPIVTRRPNQRGSFGIPPPTRCLIEFGIAIPVVILTLVVLATANYLLGRLLPGTSLTPDAVSKWATSPDRTLVSIVLLFSFTFAPISEELFFRGFLQNAFRARMPWIVAVVAQCLIFGFGHLFFYGALHAVVAFFLGLLLTLLYEWRKTLISPIFVHAGINLLAALGTAAMMANHADSALLGVVGDQNDSVCVIRGIVPNSAAEEVDLQVGDVITSLNGKPIRNFQHLIDTVRSYRPSDAVTLTLDRAGSSVEVKVVLRRCGDL